MSFEALHGALSSRPTELHSSEQDPGQPAKKTCFAELLRHGKALHIPVSLPVRLQRLCFARAISKVARDGDLAAMLTIRRVHNALARMTVQK